MSGQYKRKGTVDDVYDVTSLGGGLKFLRKRKSDFDHLSATDFLDKIEEFVGDRPLKQSHVDDLIRAMKRGTFHPEWVSIITCKLGDKVYRMNGQHTAWARLDMPPKWPCEVTILEYEASTVEDMRTLYSTIDRGSPRTRANVIDSYLVGTEEFKEAKVQTIRFVPRGFTCWFWPTKNERSKHDGDDVAYLLKTDHYDLTLKICSFLNKYSPREHKHIFRGGVIGAMFATFHKAPQIATDFWSPVADGIGFSQRSDPRLKLRNELMQTAVGYGGGARSDKKKVSQELMFRNCIHAWNAFRENRVLQVLRGNEAGKRTRVV